MATGKLAITFNPAGVSALTSRYLRLGNADNVYNYITVGKLQNGSSKYVGGDPLNNLQSKASLSPPGKRINVYTNSNKLSHGIDWFQNTDLKIMNNNFKSKIWITLVLSILLAFSSCGLPYCKKVPFSKNDLEWLSPYTIGDTIIYVNDKTYENDTVIVTDKSIYNPSNTNIFDLRGCNWLEGDNEFKAIAVYEFKIIHNQKKFHCMTILEKESNGLPAMISFGFFGKYTNKGYSTKEGLGKTPLFPNYEGNIVVTDSNLHAGKSQLVLPLSELYWNKEKGLLGYQIEDTIYTLKE